MRPEAGDPMPLQRWPATVRRGRPDPCACAI